MWVVVETFIKELKLELSLFKFLFLFFMNGNYELFSLYGTYRHATVLECQKDIMN